MIAQQLFFSIILQAPHEPTSDPCATQVYDSMQGIPYMSGLTWPNRGAKWTPGCVVLRETLRDAGERGSRNCRHAGATANDNGEAEARVETAVLTLARLIGRRIAREDLDRLDAANDNAPEKDAGEK